MKSVASLSAAMAILTGTTDAFWRMGCHSRTGLARLDPLVEPDTISNHGHVIHGGSNFGMTTTFDGLRDSECTSCLVTEDKSAYWTPSLHFIYENGTSELVPQVGGMLAYYLLMGDDIKAFPKGFQLLAGDTRLRNFSGPVPDPEKSLWTEEDKTQHALGQKAIGFNCLNYKKQPEGSMYRHFLPDKEYMDANCDDGIRAELFFPSCWNGKDVDSDNHRDHVQYPDLVNDGKCPEGFETRVPSLFFETIWNTAHFKGVNGQFVWSNGDPTGYGYHGDFIMGWDVDFLQNAVDTCTNPSGRLEDCPAFADFMQSENDGRECTFQIPDVLKDDNCAGPADALCGNVPIQAGPAYASVIEGGNEATPTPGYTPGISTDPVVPTLSYSSPTAVLTDKYGGGITIANVKPTDEADAPAPESPEPAPTSSATPAVEEAPAKESPSPTPAPVEEEAPKGKIISTSTYTKEGVVYEVVIEQVEVIVTVDAPPAPPKHKRHAHHMHMHRRDREHGLLGRH